MKRVGSGRYVSFPESVWATCRRFGRKTQKLPTKCVYCVRTVYFLPPRLKFVSDWPAISVSSWVTVTSVANDMVWLTGLIFHS